MRRRLTLSDSPHLLRSLPVGPYAHTRPADRRHSRIPSPDMPDRTIQFHRTGTTLRQITTGYYAAQSAGSTVADHTSPNQGNQVGSRNCLDSRTDTGDCRELNRAASIGHSVNKGIIRNGRNFITHPLRYYLLSSILTPKGLYT
jgi:hypothetical protein